MKTATITDSTAALPESLAKHPDVYQVYLQINLADGSTMTDTSDRDQVTAYYHSLASMKTLPRTSQPSMGEVVQVMDDLVAKGYDEVLIMTFPSALSGTFQNCQSVAQDYQDRLSVYLMDTRQTSIPLAYLVEVALNLIEAGNLSLAEIVVLLNHLDEAMVIYVIVGNLDNLVKGGRVSKGMALLGNLLKIFPIVRIERNGALEMVEKVRTQKKALKRMEELMEKEMTAYSEGVELALITTPDSLLAEEFEQMITKDESQYPIRHALIPPVIGTHLGCNSVAFCVLPKVENFKL
ncbi:DegV family protein [Aerococcus urinae]|uniref:DegV family protein n=1 Tax=Aerococcus urinae TaxID=1376 RepID=UPI00254D84F0|nr:DegV family protein [Aerococcus urinae]MDK7715482.1 DegV family protein [Aerococcus urinae]